MSTVNEKMTAIADNIRSYTGETEKLSLDDMAESIEKVYEKGKAEGKDIQVKLTADEVEVGGLSGTDGTDYPATNRARTGYINCTTEHPVSIVCNSNVWWVVHFFNNDTWIEKVSSSSLDSKNCENVMQLCSNPNEVTHIRILLGYASSKDITDIDDLLSNITITKWIVVKTYEDGIQAEYDRFWDNYQGTKTNYNYGFAGSGWNNATFKPKYPLNNMKYAEALFRYAYITNLNLDIDTSNLIGAAGDMFANSKIETIKSFKFSSTVALPYAFRYANNLKNITIVGEIPFSTRFNDCPLTHDSLMSIINALKSGVTQTLTLGTDNLAKLTDTEKAIATEKGWTLT